MTRRRTFALLPLVALLALAGCAGPDPDVVTDSARATFDALVARAADVDPAVLRTLQTAEPADQECARPEGSSQTAFTATGTLSVAADPAEASRIRSDLAGTLDGGEWSTIRAAEGSPAQQAWISEENIVTTLTVDGPTLVIAVFTPCLSS
ncbi:hypothetical protein AB0N73_04410 [Microbacterium sp. NPDC089189]|uniref:hypothetical protein n=1 Tax=Microbacterium sp. NPDC089189 TaxID=3154972 RepID=UPI0034133C83